MAFTIADLKREVSATGSHFFDRETMRLFGDTMANFGLRRAKVKTMYGATGKYTGPEGLEADCWELYRKRPVKNGGPFQKSSFYFRCDNFRRVFPVEG